MMKNKFKKALQAAVILSCATLFPWQAMAAEVEEVEYEVYYRIVFLAISSNIKIIKFIKSKTPQFSLRSFVSYR